MADKSSDLVEPDRRQHPPPSYDAPGPQVISTDTARSAVTGKPVLWVLIASLGSAFALLMLYWGFWSVSRP
ncbi:hypothetical protein [Phreatobacter sp.]|uniref:hypothetical protein n=1 Tax=Phreatobacter sp. TaxID=1966341 RepID=UPI0022C4D5EE|nr:hypothetical protein [Phreatobacter sp.]MCZ8313976.1 hypothetical protein [Phreatobacter sp.]